MDAQLALLSGICWESNRGYLDEQSGMVKFASNPTTIVDRNSTDLPPSMVESVTRFA